MLRNFITNLIYYKLKKITYTLFNYIPVIYAFLLPFGGTISVLIVLWFIISLFCFDREKIKNGYKNKWFLILLSFFVIHVISAFISENKTGGLRMIELSSGFLGFPYFFFLFTIKPDTIKKILMAFVSGCFIALFACLGRASWFYFCDGVNYFYYNDFSYFMHAGYFSMYMLFASVLVFFVYPTLFAGDKWVNNMRILFIVLFATGIFLCASKIGLIAFVFIALMVPVIKFRKEITIWKTIIVLATAVILMVTIYKVFPTPFVRLTTAMNTTLSADIDKTSGESTAVRILIWKECLEIIKQNVFFGVGVGDANDVLFETYRQKGLTGASEHNLNAHNQFFQTFIGSGLIGFVLLLISTAGAVIYGFLKRNSVLVLFGVIIVLNFLVESMLQAQAGNLFFVFFLCLLLTNDWLNQERKIE